MTRFIADITEDQKAKLEEHRAARGLRSLADAFRDLIDRCADKRMPVPNSPNREG